MRTRGLDGLSAVLLTMSLCSHVLQAQAPAVSRGWRAARTAAIKIHAPSGVLEVEGWARDSVAISGTLASGETLFGGGSLTGIKLGAEGSASSGVTRLVVRVPSGARVVVRSGAANVTVRGVTGTVDVGSAAGDVDVTGALDAVTVESLSGSVRVAATSAIVRARTTAGRLDVTGRIGEAQLTSVSGRVTVSSDPIGSMRIETVDGGVEVRGRLAATGSLDVETFGGPVHLGFPVDQRAALDLRASSGEIAGRVTQGPDAGSPLDLRLAAVRNGPTSTLVRTIGKGTGAVPPVTVRTFRGRITVGTDPLRR